MEVRSMMPRSLPKIPKTNRNKNGERSPCVVRSLASGSFANNNSNDNNSSRQKPTARTMPPSPSFLTSTIGACTGVGGIPFLEERKEEQRIEYGCRSGRAYDCYGKPSHNDENSAVEDLIVRFTTASALPLSKPETVRTMETTTDDSTSANPNSCSFDTSAATSFPTPQKQRQGRRRPSTTPSYKPPNNHSSSAFSSAKKLIFGSDSYSTNGSESWTTTKSRIHESPTGPFQCHCENDEDPSEMGKNNLYRWYGSPSTSSRSLMKSSFPAAMYAPAYDDDETDDTSALLDDNHRYEDVDTLATIRSSSLHNGSIHVPNSNLHSPNPESDGNSEIQYWRQRLNYASKNYGKSHSSTADAFFNLGLAQLKLPGSNNSSSADTYRISNNPKDENTKKRHQFDLAIENLTIAHGILERKHGSNHVAVGRALDALALAVVRRANHDKLVASNTRKPSSNTANRTNDLKYAQRLLEQAFHIRAHHLGVWHVDTVETYNKLASVYLHLGQIQEAAKAYGEVFLVRKAIFGANHPSVAISAHSLANCYYRLKHANESLKWYQVSLDVYETMGLPYRHPTVAKLLKDRSRLEQFMEG